MSSKKLTLLILCAGFFIFDSYGYTEPSDDHEANSDQVTAPDSGQFIRMHPMLIPVIQDKEVVATYSIQLVIEAFSVNDADSIRKIQPTVRDALLTDMYGVFSVVWDSKKRVHLPDFKTRLLRVAHRVAGKERIKSILVQSFQQQISTQHRGFDYRK
tara:strand:+ start:4217 stop:4687 length:471 start_codon:yes stop_codon:yes gene_type:complete